MKEKLEQLDVLMVFIATIITILIMVFVADEETAEATATEERISTTEEPTTTTEETTEQATTEEPTTEQISTRRSVTDEEYKLLLRVCMSECGGKWGEPLEGKVAVVETVLNRVDLGYGTITEVITAPYQYSTADNGEPDETVIEAVEMALSGDMYPNNMIWFRTDYFHSFGTPYKQIGAHYFSLVEVE